MMTSRDFTSIINFILDNICPPILRDCYPLMFPIYYLAYGKQTARLLKYKDRYPFLSEAGICGILCLRGNNETISPPHRSK